MFVRRSAALLAMAAAVPALALILPDTCREEPFAPIDGGEIVFWNTAGKVWPTSVSSSPPFIYVPDNCGNNGLIGIRYLSGGAYGMGAWTDEPAGSCPDARMTRLLGTNEQTPYSSKTGDVCAIRTYSAGVGDEESYIIEVDFSKYDCTPLGAPQAGASYAGTVIGFSDFYSGYYGTITQYQFQGTVTNGATATDFKTWSLYNSDGESGATELQTWIPGTSSGILTGTDYQAPPGTYDPAGDVQFGLMSMSPNERYTSLKITVTTTQGTGDYAGMTLGSIPLQPCPPGWYLNEETQRCYPCPAGTYYNTEAGTCIPCMKGLSTFGCASTTHQQCHKPCTAGTFWDAEDMMCKRCPPGTYWPTTYGLETDACIPCANPRRELKSGNHTAHPTSGKYGAKSCPAYPNKPAKKPIGA